MNATPTTKITTPIENSGLDTLYMTDSKADAFAVYMIQPVGADDVIGWCLDKDQANEIVRAVNSFDAMKEALEGLYDVFNMRLSSGLALNQVLPKEAWGQVARLTSQAARALANGRS